MSSSRRLKSLMLRSMKGSMLEGCYRGWFVLPHDREYRVPPGLNSTRVSTKEFEGVLAAKFLAVLFIREYVLQMPLVLL